MAEPRELLGDRAGGRVLDVATGRGGFVHFLLEGLPSYDEIVAIDTSAELAPAFQEAFADRPNVRFTAMDAATMSFPDDSFDTVAVSSSLHHFADPSAVLSEMRRVCRPGGRIVVLEMYRDGQGEPQQTHVQLHHWWAAVDTLGGTVHNPTYTRAEVITLVEALKLTDFRVVDVADDDTDPMSPETVAELEPVIDRYITAAEGHPELVARGEELRRRLHEVGFLVATSILVVGRV